VEAEVKRMCYHEMRFRFGDAETPLRFPAIGLLSEATAEQVRVSAFDQSTAVAR